MQSFRGTVPPDKALRVTADRPHRYTVEFVATGAKIEFVMLAGQSFTVSENRSDVVITMDDVEAPAGGLHLVARAGQGLPEGYGSAAPESENGETRCPS